MDALIFPALVFFAINASHYSVAIEYSPLRWKEFPYDINEGWIPQPKNVSWGVCGQAFYWTNSDGSRRCWISVRSDFTPKEKRDIIFHELCHCERWMHQEMQLNKTQEETICEAYAIKMMAAVRG